LEPYLAGQHQLAIEARLVTPRAAAGPAGVGLVDVRRWR
jgi:hypothetical protein